MEVQKRVENVASDERFLRALPHLQLAWNTPLSRSHADRLLAWLKPEQGSRVVDLGCGWGGLLLRALAQAPMTTGEAIDQNPGYLERARREAQALGVGDRVRFLQGDIVQYAGVGDRVICIGADHAWGSAGAALPRLSPRVETGGLLLFGCGYWNRPAAPELIEMFGRLPTSFEAVLDLARSSGWAVLSADAADLEEWDDFEMTWNQDLAETARSEPDTPLGARALRLVKQRRKEYERGYRGVLGFAYLTLARDQEAGSE